jgi:hypothetical protein
MGLSFTIADGPSQRSHSRARVPRDTTIFYCLRFENPPTWRARPPVFISPRNRVAQLYPPRTGVPFSSPPTTFCLVILAASDPRYTSSGRPPQKTPSLNNSYIVVSCRGNVFTEQLPCNGRLLWLQNPAFRRHITLYIVSLKIHTHILLSRLYTITWFYYYYYYYYSILNYNWFLLLIRFYYYH